MGVGSILLELSALGRIELPANGRSILAGQKGVSRVVCVAAAVLLACAAQAGQSGTQQPAPAPQTTPQPPARNQASGGTTGKDTTGKSASKATEKASAQQAVAELLENKIRAAWKAFKDKDANAYAEFLADDLMAVEEDAGGERTKMKVLREVDDSVVRDFKLQLFRVDPIAPGAELVTYENFIQFPVTARPRFEKIFISEIWLKRAGEWKMWRYQATRVK